MEENKKIVFLAIVFLALTLFLALAQEASQVESENSTQNSETVRNSSNLTLEKTVDFDVSTALEKSKIVRGENVLLFVNITNTGNTDLNLKVSLELPEKIVSSEKEKECSLQASQTCSLTFTLSTSLETSLGKNEIKVKVWRG